MPVPFTDVAIEWYAYRDRLSDAAAGHCVIEAWEEAKEHLDRSEQTDSLSSQRPYSYTVEGVNLYLRLVEGEVLDWASWDEVLRQFGTYGYMNDWKGTQFLIFRPADDAVVASGHLLAAEA